MENVTQERAKWRSAIRALADALIKAAREGDTKEAERHCAQLALNVNPFDAEDKALVEIAKKLSESPTLDGHLVEFTDRIALLLKHDWERAKREAHPWFLRGGDPRRVPYCEFKVAGVAPVSIAKPLSSWWLVPYFGMLAFSAGIMFFLAAGLTEPFQELLKIFNDAKIEKPMGAWVQFVFWSVLCGSMWSAAYLWFKGSEKKFLDIWFSK
jgi:hypothetical protein